MIGILGGKHLAAMQQQTAELAMEVEALSQRLTATTDELSAVSERLAVAIGQIEAQAAGMAEAERQAEATLTRIAADHAAAIARLDEQEEGRRELDGRVRGDMDRIERQALIDVTELRQTCLALAERLLPNYGRGADVQAAATEYP